MSLQQAKCQMTWLKNLFAIKSVKQNLITFQHVIFQMIELGDAWVFVIFYKICFSVLQFFKI